MSERFDSIFRPGLFEGQVILVTGGGTGLGRCTAHELAALGATVVIAARREEPLQQTVGEIEKAGGTAFYEILDVRDEEAVETTVARIVEERGRLDGLVNNAGGQFVSPVHKMNAKGWRTVIDLILNSTFMVSNAAYNHWMKDHGGAIVNMLADIWTGFPGMAHMSAARAGVENLGWSLAQEWCHAGVRVNAIAPGTVLSSGMLHYPDLVQDRTVAEAKDATPARLGTESEVSAAIAFLLSPAAAYITGATLQVDGGSRFQKNRLMPPKGVVGLRPWNGFHLRPSFKGTKFEEMAGED